MSRWPKGSKETATSFGGLSRSELMSRIRSTRNGTTEIKLLKLLRTAKVTGWRRNYPLLGKPDFAFPACRVAVFVDGCFWHGHACGRNLSPRSNVLIWKEKFERNRRRDRRVSGALRRHGWKVLRIWECSLNAKPEHCLARVVRTCAERRVQ